MCPPKTALQTMTADLKELILKLHNSHRNTVANGNLNGFSSANRMARMVITLKEILLN